MRKKKAILIKKKAGLAYSQFTFDRYYAHMRNPNQPTGDVLLGSIWKQSWTNGSRRDIWLLDGENEITINSPLGAYLSEVQSGETFGEWLASTPSTKAYFYDIKPQGGVGGRFLCGNGVAVGKVIESNVVLTDSVGNPTVQMTPTGTSHFKGSVAPSYLQTGDYDYTITVLGRNSSAGTIQALAAQGNSNTDKFGLQIFCDRSAGKKCVEYNIFEGAVMGTIYMPSQMDDGDMRWVTITVESNILKAYVNGIYMGEIDITGVRTWLDWQGRGMDFGSQRGIINRLNGDLTFLRISEGALSANNVLALYGLDTEYYNL